MTYDLEATETPKSPGQLLRHYAPGIPLRLKAVDVELGEALLAFGSTKFMGIRGGGFAKDLPQDAFYNLSEQGDSARSCSQSLCRIACARPGSAYAYRRDGYS